MNLEAGVSMNLEKGVGNSRRGMSMNVELTRIIVGQTGGGWGCRKTGCFQNVAPGASYEERRQAEEPPLAQPEDLGEEVSCGCRGAEPHVVELYCGRSDLLLLWSCDIVVQLYCHCSTCLLVVLQMSLQWCPIVHTALLSSLCNVVHSRIVVVVVPCCTAPLSML